MQATARDCLLAIPGSKQSDSMNESAYTTSPTAPEWSNTDFYPPESLAQMQPALQAAIQHGTPWDLELPLITATGRHIWVRTQCSAILEGNKVVRLRGAFHDITERKLSELALRSSKDFNVSVLESLSEHIAVLDERGVIVAVNEAWRRFGLANGGTAKFYN